MVSFSPDETLFLGQAGRYTGIFATASGAPALLLPDPPPGWTGPFASAAYWSLDGRNALVVRRLAPNQQLVDIIHEGRPQQLPHDAVTARWSRDGTRLAVVGAEQTMIFSEDGRPTLRLPGSGWNPRWSGDDRYLGIVSPQNLAVIRLFDTWTGDEVLRSFGRPACIGDYWVTPGAIGGVPEDEAVSVPDGHVISVQAPDPPKVSVRSLDGRVVQLIADGAIAAELRLETEYWSPAYSRADAGFPESAGLGAISLGVGGRGACDSGSLTVRVELPPFAGEPEGWP